MGVGWRGGPLVLPVRVSCSWKGETVDGGKTALACPTEGRARALPGRHAAAARGVPTAAATPRPGGAGPDGNPTAARGYAVGGRARLPPSRAARCTPPPRSRPVRPPAPHWPLAPPHRVPAGFAGTQTEQRGHQVRAAHTSSVTRTATPSAAAEPAGGAPGRSACVTPHPVSSACTRSHPVRGAGVSGVCSAFLVTNEAECFSHGYGHLNGVFLNPRLRSLALSAEQAPFEMLQESRLRGRPRPA